MVQRYDKLHRNTYPVRLHYGSDDLHQPVRLQRVDGPSNDLHRNADPVRIAEPDDLRAPTRLPAGQ